MLLNLLAGVMAGGSTTVLGPQPTVSTVTFTKTQSATCSKGATIGSDVYVISWTITANAGSVGWDYKVYWGTTLIGGTSNSSATSYTWTTSTINGSGGDGASYYFSVLVTQISNGNQPQGAVGTVGLYLGTCS